MCQHAVFDATVHVNRMVDGERISFVADISIVCRACKQPFCFVGLPSGVSPLIPAASFDGTTARLPIAPADIVALARHTMAVAHQLPVNHDDHRMGDLHRRGSPDIKQSGIDAGADVGLAADPVSISLVDPELLDRVMGTDATPPNRAQN